MNKVGGTWSETKGSREVSEVLQRLLSSKTTCRDGAVNAASSNFIKNCNFICLCVPDCMYVHHLCRTPWRLEEVSDPRELEL